MKKLFTTVLFLAIYVGYGQHSKTEVLSLGTFHFAFHNRDVIKTDKKDQINVLDKKYQLEIEDIVNQIVKFNPTIIAIERDPELQPKIDSLYTNYLNGKHSLSREEYEQIGFRVAKRLGLKKLYCVNDWGKNYKNIDSLLTNNKEEYKRFINAFKADSLQMYVPKDVFKSEGIKAQLRLLNSKEHLQKDLGNYMVGVFKHETDDNRFFGADFTSGWWFNRNLRIFRNIQKIQRNPKDKILVIYGAGHMNLLNLFFSASPEFQLVATEKYLK